MRQALASKDMNMEAEESIAGSRSQGVTGEDCVLRYSDL